MKTEINPKETSRAIAFEIWMSSPMPMVTVVKTFDVTRLYRNSKRKGLKFNMLLCWCICRAASSVAEFYTLPENGKLYRYDRIALNTIVNNKNGGLSFCDIPYTNDFQKFNNDYNSITQSAKDVGCDWYRTRLYCKSIYRHLQQSVFVVGKIQKTLVQGCFANLVSISSRSDGRRTCGEVFRKVTRRNLQVLTFFL